MDELHSLLFMFIIKQGNAKKNAKTTALGEYNTKRAESNNNNRWMQQHKEQKQWNEDIESNATMFVKNSKMGNTTIHGISVKHFRINTNPY